VGTSAKADSFSYTFNPNAPTVTIIFDAGNGMGGGNGIPNTSSGGTSVPETTKVGLFTVTDTSSPSSPLLPATTFQAFCLDLWHTNNQSSSNPTNFTGTVTDAATTNFAGGQYFPSGYTPNSNLGNQLTYMGVVFSAISKSDLNALGAMQLALWSLIDQKPPGSLGFQFTGANSTVLADYKTIIAALGGTVTSPNSYGYVMATGIDGTHNGTAGMINGTPLAAYNANTNYSIAITAAVIAPDGGFLSTRSQDLITFGPRSAIVTPEPSTMAIAGLGALGFSAYGWKRRKQPRPRCQDRIVT
jgi:hypothetical protein